MSLRLFLLRVVTQKSIPDHKKSIQDYLLWILNNTEPSTSNVHVQWSSIMSNVIKSQNHRILELSERDYMAWPKASLHNEFPRWCEYGLEQKDAVALENPLILCVIRRNQ